MVAGCEVVDGCADGLDDTGSLVAEDDGQLLRGRRGDHPEIGVADPGADEANPDLVRPGLLQVEVLEGEGGSGTAQDGSGGLHEGLFRRTGAVVSGRGVVLRGRSFMAGTP